MFVYERKIRVRYAETDQMGYVYHANYLAYFEEARTEALRDLGLAYRDMERQGVMLPVLEANVKYIRPARYDDLLTVKVIMRELPGVRLKFEYEVYKEDGTKINLGRTTLVFVDMRTGKPTEAPENILKLFYPFFENVAPKG
ncbi:thioesterase [Fulvitalea axinellae]|uniref:Thioesterase n=1 Tax=Fulvitalea axinellae TaxID=1182444 RepID=A0AAU9CTC2_9BACT|nr:thioesterase [Fulvitalea axinellae]